MQNGDTVVFLEDECHLHYRDAQGYVWGPSSKRVTVEMKNESERKTYYGALDIMQGNVVLKEFKTGETASTVAFVGHLLNVYKGKKIKLIWDGASYHKSEEFQAYLEKVNEGLEKKDWRVECILLAPYAPEENPIEYVWLAAKKLLRECWHLCKSFKVAKSIFELGVTLGKFSFPKLDWYRSLFCLL